MHMMGGLTGECVIDHFFLLSQWKTQQLKGDNIYTQQPLHV